MSCISYKEEHDTHNAKTEEELKRENEDLRSKVAFLRLCSPIDHHHHHYGGGGGDDAYEKASKTEEELKRENKTLMSKVAFLQLCSPLGAGDRNSSRPDFTDVFLVASSHYPYAVSVPVPAHKFVLVSRSPVFKAMLMEEHISDTIKIIDVSHYALSAFVNYLYSAEVCLNEQMAYDLLVLGEKYQVEHLKSYCEKYLVSNLNWKNSIMNYAFAHQYNAEHLLEAALSLITDNMEKGNDNRYKLIERDDYIELVKNNPRLVLEIYHAYYSKPVNTAISS